jgi:hypothetical protein
MNDEEAFVRCLARKFSAVDSILHEHLVDNEELLPHVFFGDLTRYILKDTADRQAVAQDLEDTFSRGNSSVRDLIAVSFIENLETREELDRALHGIHGNLLRGEWGIQHPGA